MDIVNEFVKRSTTLEDATPKLASGVVYTSVFSILFAINFLTCVHYHQWWFLGTWGTGLAVEVIGYSGRIWLNLNNHINSGYLLMFTCISLAPTFLMAGIYYIFDQLVLIYGNHFSILKSRSYSTIFLFCDTISVLVQSIGGSKSVGSFGNECDIGRYIMLASLAFRIITMSFYMFCWFTFLWKIYINNKTYHHHHFNPKFEDFRKSKTHLKAFMFGISLSVILIYIRTIYRLIEIKDSYVSYLSTDEIYFDTLEGLTISLACIIMAILSPGFILGKGEDLSIAQTGFDINRNETDTYIMDTSKVRYEQSYYR